MAYKFDNNNLTEARNVKKMKTLVTPSEDDANFE